MGGWRGIGVRNPDVGVQKPDPGDRRTGALARIACGVALGAGLLMSVGLAPSGVRTYTDILPHMQTRTLVVDSVEGDRARVELADGSMLDLPLDWLPAGTGEAQVLTIDVVEDGQVRFALDEDETARRLRENQALLDSITSKPPEDFHI